MTLGMCNVLVTSICSKTFLFRSSLSVGSQEFSILNARNGSLDVMKPWFKMSSTKRRELSVSGGRLMEYSSLKLKYQGRRAIGRLPPISASVM